MRTLIRATGWAVVAGLYVIAVGCAFAAVLLDFWLLAGTALCGGTALACTAVLLAPTRVRHRAPGVNWDGVRDSMTPTALRPPSQCPTEAELAQEDARFRASLENRGRW